MKHHSNSQQTANKQPTNSHNGTKRGIIYAPQLQNAREYFDAFILLKRNRRAGQLPPLPGTPNECANLVTHNVDIDLAIFKWCKQGGRQTRRTYVCKWTRYEFIEPVTLAMIKEIESLY